jgi:CheY-like chemotaxis protein
MRDEHGSRGERRRTPRMNVSGNAVVHAAQGVVRCQLVNLSAGGALLRSTEEAGHAVALDASVLIDLHLDARRTAWIHLRGHVQRIAGAADFCVVFHDVTPQFEDLVGDEILAGIEGEARPRALIVDADPSRRAQLAEALARSGCNVVEATAPLDAIATIEQSKAHIAVVLVRAPEASAPDPLTVFLREAHPEIELAVIADRADGGRDRPGWLFTEQADFGVQVRRLIARHLVSSSRQPRPLPSA